MNKYLVNAFSIQMVSDSAHLSQLRFCEVEAPKSFEGYVSAIGHADTAQVLGVEMNRVSITLKPGDELLVAQLQGGRLPEGCTTLPEGFSFKYVRVWLENPTTEASSWDCLVTEINSLLSGEIDHMVWSGKVLTINDGDFNLVIDGEETEYEVGTPECLSYIYNEL